MKVTDEHIHDSKMLPQLVQNIIKSNSISASKLFADSGVYDSNAVFGYLVVVVVVDNGILPCVKVRKNARVKKKTNHILRNLSKLYFRNTICKDGGKIA